MSEIFSAPSKINWFLRVGDTRPDGRHRLWTLFQAFRTPADRIEADWSGPEGISLECSTPGVPSGPGNLLYDAAVRYAQLAGLSPRWRFRLEKAIPAAAGMGGGSADAGTLLRALEKRFHAVGEETLGRIAMELGADVAFFLNPGVAIGREAGEKLEIVREKLTFPAVLAIFPGFPVSAGWAYKALTVFPVTPEEGESGLSRMLEALRSGEICKAAACVTNDLEYALFDKFPLLRMLRRELMDTGALAVHISGSGSTIFGLFENRACRDDAASVMEERRNNMRIMKLEAWE